MKKGFEGFDKEQSGIISGTAMQMIFKMMGVNVQVSELGRENTDIIIANNIYLIVASV